MCSRANTASLERTSTRPPSRCWPTRAHTSLVWGPSSLPTPPVLQRAVRRGGWCSFGAPQVSVLLESQGSSLHVVTVSQAASPASLLPCLVTHGPVASIGKVPRQLPLIPSYQWQLRIHDSLHAHHGMRVPCTVGCEDRKGGSSKVGHRPWE